MHVYPVQNQSTSFGSVRKISYPKYYDQKMKTNLHFNNLEEVRQHLQIVDEFDKRIADLKNMPTNIKEILNYDELIGDDKNYADALLKRVPENEKEDLTVGLSMSNNNEEIGSTFCHGYLAIDYPTLAEEWKRLPESYMDPKLNITYHLTKGECRLEDDITFFDGRLPVPKPNYLQERIKESLLHDGKVFYEYDKRQHLKN